MEVSKMGEENPKLEQNEHEKPISFIGMVIFTGFVGGILWGGLGYLAYVLNFTEIHPRVVLDPWAIGDWKKGWLGTVISIIFIGGASIIAALIYYATLRRMNHIIVGVLFGILLFLLVFIVLNPIFPGMEPIKDLKKTTIVTAICLYVLFGTFVGYSISYEENEIRNNRNVHT
jgi:hypothetical protein